MREIDILTVWLCIACTLLISLCAELGRKRLGSYPDLALPLRWTLHLLSLFFVARADRIIAGYGEADVSEALVYATLVFTVMQQVAVLVRQAWCDRVERAKLDVIPELKEAVREAAAESVPAVLPELKEVIKEATAEIIPGYLQDLARAPADYEHRVAIYPPSGTTPHDPTIPRT